MNIQGKHTRTIWLNPQDKTVVQVIDQRFLPFEFVIEDLKTVDEVAVCIKEMHIRGAGLIGATAGYGVYIAALQAAREGLAVGSQAYFERIDALGAQLKATRPTAVNLEWGVDRAIAAMKATPADPLTTALKVAEEIADEDADFCRRIGDD